MRPGEFLLPNPKNRGYSHTMISIRYIGISFFSPCHQPGHLLLSLRLLRVSA